MSEWSQVRLEVVKGDFQCLLEFLELRKEELIKLWKRVDGVEKRINEMSKHGQISDECAQLLLNSMKKTKSKRSTEEDFKYAIELLNSAYQYLENLAKRKEEIYPLAQKQMVRDAGNKKRNRRDHERIMKYGRMYHEKWFELALRGLRGKNLDNECTEYVLAEMQKDGQPKFAKSTIRGYGNLYSNYIKSLNQIQPTSVEDVETQ